MGIGPLWYDINMPNQNSGMVELLHSFLASLLVSQIMFWATTRFCFYKVTFFHGKKRTVWKETHQTNHMSMACHVQQPCKGQHHKQCQERSHLRKENGNREGHLSRDQCFVGSHLGVGLYIASTMNPWWNWEYDLKVGGFVMESHLKNLCKCRQNMMKSNHFSSMFCFFVSELFHKQSFFKHNLTLKGLSYICSQEIFVACLVPILFPSFSHYKNRFLSTFYTLHVTTQPITKPTTVT